MSEKDGEDPETYFSSKEIKKVKDDNTRPEVRIGLEHDSEINDVHAGLVPKKDDNPMKEINYNKKIIYIKMFICVFVACCVPFNAFINFLWLMGNEHSKVPFVWTHMFNVFLPLSELFVFIGIMIYLGYKFFRGSRYERTVFDFFSNV
jgi:hypothetical protein